MSDLAHGDGYAVSSLGQMGDGPGFRKVVRVDAATHRGLRNVGQDTAVVAGGKDGYVGRDGQAVGDNPRGGPPGAPA
jgi:hypothetical protein